MSMRKRRSLRCRICAPGGRFARAVRAAVRATGRRARLRCASSRRGGGAVARLSPRTQARHAQVAQRQRQRQLRQRRRGSLVRLRARLAGQVERPQHLGAADPSLAGPASPEKTRQSGCRPRGAPRSPAQARDTHLLARAVAAALRRDVVRVAAFAHVAAARLDDARPAGLQRRAQARHLVAQAGQQLSL